jgi:arginine decarboxylase
MAGCFVPKRVFFTSGVGESPDKLASFEMALRKASIHCYNLVEVSSILPPNCRIVSKEEGVGALFPGSVVFTVMSRLSANEPHRRISASVGIAVPENMDENWGYFAEHHAFGQTKEQAGSYAERLAHEMYQGISDKLPMKTMNVTETGVVNDAGDWKTVIAAAVFVME